MLQFPKPISLGTTDKTDVHTIARPAMFLENWRTSEPTLALRLNRG